MGKIKDLTGQTFGHLTVIKDTGERKNRQVVWECECDCENHPHIKVLGGSLRSGHTTSCGCSRKGKNVIDLTGQTFGDLTVLCQQGTTNNRQAIWLCKCKCGKERAALGYELKNGSVSACFECTKQNIIYKLPTYKKIHNQKFGKLTALNPTDKRDNGGHILWECQCDCGNRVYVSSNSLLTYNTLSCGCSQVSIGEEKIKTILMENNINFSRQYSFSDCKSPKNSLLFFDFAIFDNNNKLLNLIEYDGIQHYQPVDFFGGEDYFNYLQQCDNIKNQYCQNNNINLIRIKYDNQNFSLQDLLGE